MNLAVLAQSVLKYSPAVATALTGPIGGMVASMLASSFGVDTEALPAAIATDPDAAVKIHQIELEHGATLALIEATDRSNARATDTANTQATGKRDWILHVLALSFTSFFFFYICISQFYFATLDKGMFHDLMNAEIIILMFYFGGMYKSKS